MPPLTPRQRECLAFIAEFWRSNGYPPSMREISEKMGMVMPGGCFDHVAALTRKGFIEHVHGQSRTITITAFGWKELGVTGCPFCGNCKENAA